jgi:putative toxin-antitoxin system antitoxin component (TIGR02293 family)
MSETMQEYSQKIEDKLNKEILSLLNNRRKQIKSQRNSMRKASPITFKQFLTDKLLIISAIRSGIPFSLFQLIQVHSPFTENEWASFLGISVKSLQRYKVNSRYHFKSLQSEKIIELAEVIQLGLEVFGEMEKLKLWLNTPNFSLGNEKPVSLLHDSYGKELVASELVRINHGIFV